MARQLPDTELLARLNEQISWPFVGRTGERSKLERLLAEAGQGEPRLVFVRGEAGAGKSRLCLELLGEADRRGWQTLKGRCLEDAPAPLAAFESEFVPRLDQAGLLRAQRGDLDAAALRSSVRRRPPARTRVGLAPEPAELGSALARKAADLATLRPVLLLVDDVQRLEGGALDAFRSFTLTLSDVARQRRVPILVACTVRLMLESQPVSEVVDRLQREPFCRVVELGGLNEIETHAFIREMTGADCEPRLLDVLATATRGNPLHLAESLRTLAAQGAVVVQGATLVARGVVDDLDIPGSAPAAVRPGLARLPADLRTVVEFAALLGDEFDVEGLSAVVSRDDLPGLLDAAVAHRLLAGDGVAYRFVHGLVRQAVLDSIGPARRRAMHSEVAGALLARFGDRPPRLLEIAAHLASAGDADCSAQDGALFERAGDEAMTLFAWNLGARYFDRALRSEAYLLTLDSRARGTLDAKAARALNNIGDLIRARERFMEAVERFREARDHRGWGLALLGWERTFTSLNEPISDTRPYDEFRESAGDSVPDVQARLLAHWAQTRWLAGAPDDIDAAVAALEAAERVDDAETRAQTMMTMGLVRMRHLEPQESLAAFQAAFRAASGIANPRIRGLGGARQVIPLVMLGQVREAREAAGRSLIESTGGNDWPHSALNLAMLYTIHVLLGDFDAARPLLVDATTMIHRSAYVQASFFLDAAVGRERLLRGEYEEAEDAFSSWALQGGRANAWPSQLLVKLSLDGAGAVLADIQSRPLPSASAVGNTMPGLARACATVELAEALGSADLAGLVFEALEGAMAAGVKFSVAPPMLLPRVAGTAARLLGRFSRSEELLDEALAVAQSTGAQPEIGQTHLAWARLVAERDPGDAARIGEHLDAALKVFRALDMGPLADEVRRLARAWGIVSHDTSLFTVAEDELSATERDVLREFGAGLSVAQIATRLLLSERTVEDHVRRLGRRLGIASAREAEQFLARGDGGTAVRDQEGQATRRRRVDSPAQDAPAGLSHREMEVIGLIARGCTNQQIADELVISLHTVARHVANIFNKTGAANRTEAAHFVATARD